MNTIKVSSEDRRVIEVLETQLAAIRTRLDISPPRTVLFQEGLSYADTEIVIVEADGFGGALLLVVDGNYPLDFVVSRQRDFSTESEALEFADELLSNSALECALV